MDLKTKDEMGGWCHRQQKNERLTGADRLGIEINKKKARNQPELSSQ
jgi:hypothetical protein